VGYFAIGWDTREPGMQKPPALSAHPRPGCLSVNRGHREPSSAQKILRSTSALRRDP